jgi:NTE family protein
MELMEGGEHSTYPNLEAIRICTRIGRTMEDILHRFEYGDLRPDASKYHRPRSSRRRPPPTRADREAQREFQVHSDKLSKPASKPATASKKVATRKKATTRKKSNQRSKAAPKTPAEGDKGVVKAA